MRRLPRPLLAAVGLALVPALATPTIGVMDASAEPGPAVDTSAAGKRQVHFEASRTAAEWRRGTLDGVEVHGNAVRMAAPTGRRTHAGRAYETARWRSAWVRPGFHFDRLVASWSASTPGGSWIEVAARGTQDGTRSSWDVLGRWAAGDGAIQRASVSGQDDDLARVNVDTLETSRMGRYQLQVTLLRPAGSAARPRLRMAGAMVSNVPDGASATSRPGPGRGTTLDVPSYSQMTHRGHYPQWGGGGEAWCSPTSVSMVLGYYDRLPKPRNYAWVGQGHAQPWVDHAARMSYDHAYRGTGNWSFSTAYGAARAGDGFVTRLRSLREAERFIAAGIPLVVSIAFARGELDGTPISSSNGHLLVVAGFTRDGDVVVNDPAAATNAGVRRTYDRAQLERVWQKASGGTTYVITDKAHPLPKSRGNW